MHKNLFANSEGVRELARCGTISQRFQRFNFSQAAQPQGCCNPGLELADAFSVSFSFILLAPSGARMAAGICHSAPFVLLLNSKVTD